MSGWVRYLRNKANIAENTRDFGNAIVIGPSEGTNSGLYDLLFHGQRMNRVPVMPGSSVKFGAQGPDGYNTATFGWLDRDKNKPVILDKGDSLAGGGVKWEASDLVWNYPRTDKTVTPYWMSSGSIVPISLDYNLPTDKIGKLIIYGENCDSEKDLEWSDSPCRNYILNSGEYKPWKKNELSTGEYSIGVDLFPPGHPKFAEPRGYSEPISAVPMNYGYMANIYWPYDDRNSFNTYSYRYPYLGDDPNLLYDIFIQQGNQRKICRSTGIYYDGGFLPHIKEEKGHESTYGNFNGYSAIVTKGKTLSNCISTFAIEPAGLTILDMFLRYPNRGRKIKAELWITDYTEEDLPEWPASYVLVAESETLCDFRKTEVSGSSSWIGDSCNYFYYIDYIGGNPVQKSTYSGDIIGTIDTSSVLTSLDSLGYTPVLEYTSASIVPGINVNDGKTYFFLGGLYSLPFTDDLSLTSILSISSSIESIVPASYAAAVHYVYNAQLPWDTGSILLGSVPSSVNYSCKCREINFPSPVNFVSQILSIFWLSANFTIVVEKKVGT